MDFKGITWAGNIYQKFEAMCLEVEEAMYQDTVKYVENQVQKVGVSVKKFYSEVIEDLAPPSCVDPINVASGDLSLNPCGHTDINKKPKPSVFDSHHNLKNKEDHAISNVTAEKESSQSGCYDINSLSPKSPGVLVQNKCSEFSTKVGLQRRPVGIKRITKNNLPSKESCRSASLSSGERKSKLASSDVRNSSSGASDGISVMSSLDLEAIRDPGEAGKGNAPTPDTLIESPASDKILTAESLRQNEDDKDCISPANEKTKPVRQNKEDSGSISPASENNLLAEFERLNRDSGSTSSCSGLPTESTGASMKDISCSMSDTSIRSKACNLESKEVSNEGTSMKDGSSSVSTTTRNGESCDKKVIMSSEDNLNMEVIENEEVAEPRQENLKAVERENLEESCILVEGDNLHCIPHETKKHKSYKKKIREAFSSKLRSRKDNQCVSPHKDLGGTNNEEMANPVLAADSVEQKLPAHDSFESDWELL